MRAGSGDVTGRARGPRDGRRTGRAGPGRGGPDGARRRGGAAWSGPARPLGSPTSAAPGPPSGSWAHFSGARGVRGGGSPLCAPARAREAPGPRRPEGRIRRATRACGAPDLLHRCAASELGRGAQNGASRREPPSGVPVPAELVWRAWGSSSRGLGSPGIGCPPSSCSPLPPARLWGEDSVPASSGAGGLFWGAASVSPLRGGGSQVLPSGFST